MQILTVIPTRYRRYVYAVLGLAALALSAYKASQGDWLEMAGIVLGSLGFGVAASNTPDNGTGYAARHDTE